MRGGDGRMKDGVVTKRFVAIPFFNVILIQDNPILHLKKLNFV